MRMRVEPVLIGAGQLRTLEIRGKAGRSYTGTAVQLFDPTNGKWSWQYTNSVGRAAARYAGTVTGTRSEWRSISPHRTRESRLVSELLADGVWRRSMSISHDDGAHWTELWVDELRRAQ